MLQHYHSIFEITLHLAFTGSQGTSEQHFQSCSYLISVGLKPKFGDIGPTDCDCVPFGQCEWSQKIFSKITELRAQADNFKALGYSRIEYLQTWGVARSFFGKKICERKKKFVFCCGPPGSDKTTFSDFPTEKHITNDCPQEGPPKSTTQAPDRDDHVIKIS